MCRLYDPQEFQVEFLVKEDTCTRIESTDDVLAYVIEKT